MQPISNVNETDVLVACNLAQLFPAKVNFHKIEQVLFLKVLLSETVNCDWIVRNM